MRNESLEEAAMLDGKLRKLWEHHPRFVLVRHHPSFFRKISFGLAELDTMVADLAVGRKPPGMVSSARES